MLLRKKGHNAVNVINKRTRLFNGKGTSIATTKRIKNDDQLSPYLAYNWCTDNDSVLRL